MLWYLILLPVILWSWGALVTSNPIWFLPSPRTSKHQACLRNIARLEAELLPDLPLALAWAPKYWEGSVLGYDYYFTENPAPEGSYWAISRELLRCP